MEIHFQTTDHVVAVEKVAEQHIATKYSKCNSLRVISHIITLGKSAITHSKVGMGRYEKYVHREVANAKPYRFRDSAFYYTPNKHGLFLFTTSQ